MKNLTSIFRGFQLKVVLGGESSRERISEYSHATVTFDNSASPTTGPLKIIRTDAGVRASVTGQDSKEIEFYVDGKEIPVDKVSFHNN